MPESVLQASRTSSVLMYPLHSYDHDRRKTTMRLIGFAIVMATSCCLAQDSGDFRLAISNVLDAQYPRVDSNSRVQIRFKAPEATKVRVNFWSGPKADMEKQADGFWTFTTPSMAPGLHYYTVIVDGAEVSDPGSTAYFGGSRWASAVEVPEAVRRIICRRTCPMDRCAKFGITRSRSSTKCTDARRRFSSGGNRSHRRELRA